MVVFKPKSWPLAIKLPLTITAVVTIVGFMIGAFMVAQNWSRLHEALGEKALLLSESVATIAPKAMLRKDYWALYVNLRNITLQQKEIVTAMILDANGIVQAHLQPADNPLGLPYSATSDLERELLQRAIAAREPVMVSHGGFVKTGFQEAVFPLYSDQKYLGVVRVRLSVGLLYEKAIDSALLVLALVIFFVLAGSALGTVVSRRMVGPLTAVTLGLEAVGRGEMTDFDPIPIRERDEIGRLTATYNQIMAELAEKKMLEEDLAMSEKLIALGRITAGVAHEVNNPLAGLLNCIDTLRKHPDDKELIDRYLPVIDQGLHRIKDIVHNLLVGLRIEEGDELEDIEHIDKLRELIAADIGDKNIEIVWENRVDVDLEVPGKLEQIVYNLLKNAIEVLPDDGRLEFRMYLDNSHLNIEVSDNGPGIASEIRNQLFDPFFSTKPNGTGLGLWVVYRLTQNLGGIIEVESDKDRGTTFYVAVPVKTPKAA
ncbi:MAG: sensor histidine kinase [Gammaproteobacteria bacterium]